MRLQGSTCFFPLQKTGLQLKVRFEFGTFRFFYQIWVDLSIVIRNIRIQPQITVVCFLLWSFSIRLILSLKEFFLVKVFEM